MSDIELLAAILGGADACATARRLLARFGGLRPLLETDPDRFTGLKGVGEARAAMLLALPEFARRYFSEALPPGKSIRCPADTRDFLHARIRHLEHEIFCCLYLDNRHRVLRFDELFRGTIDGTSVYPREVVKEALAVNAAAVILAHNHPSGVAEPSQADERITKRIKSALDLVDIRLLDHFIIGDAETTSLASRGML
ncbi:MAG: DNA repair protein RadC [Woeseiaceae bacterium]